MYTNTESYLPVGCSDFETIRQSGAIYVDKTAHIYDLCRRCGRIFLARPQGFGKTLLVSTIASLFEHGLRDFQGLTIEKLWTDKTYDVIRLDFAEFCEFADSADFKTKFEEHIRQAFVRVDPNFGIPGEKFFSTELSFWLAERERMNLVLLIDNYDAPLLASFHNKANFARVLSTLRGFLAIIKSKEGALRFFFMTGITQRDVTLCERTSLVDLTMETGNGSLVGFSAEEIDQYLGPYLKRAAARLGTTESEIREKLTKHYGGYSFDPIDLKQVHCPLSVLKFLEHPEDHFQNYWYQGESHSPLLEQLLKGRTVKEILPPGQTMSLMRHDMKGPHCYDHLSVESMLYQTGYFTLKSKSSGHWYELGYPNQDVESSVEGWAKNFRRCEHRSRPFQNASSTFKSKHKSTQAFPDGDSLRRALSDWLKTVN